MWEGLIFKFTLELIHTFYFIHCYMFVKYPFILMLIKLFFTHKYEKLFILITSIG